MLKPPVRLILSGLLAASLLGGCARDPHELFGAAGPGRRLHFVCYGSGSPTVLFEGGFAATASAWYKVQPVLSRRTRTCAYDRAGSGRSDPGPLPRDGAAIAADLDAGLRDAGISGPFVLVGHSAGALYAQLFYARRPKDVVGMVLVDPSVKFQDQAFDDIAPGAGGVESIRSGVERCLALAKGWGDQANAKDERRCFDKKGKLLPAATWLTQISELDTLWRQTSVEVVRAHPAYGAMPIVVLTAAGTYPRDDELSARFADRWRDLHKALAAQSSRGEERLVEKSSHMIMLDQPLAIIDAVDDVLNRLGSPGAAPAASSAASTKG